MLASRYCALALFVSASASAIEPKIYRCNADDGTTVFQDHPCGTGLAPWERPLTDRTRWSDPIQRGGGCMVRSPEAKLSWLRPNQTVEFDGGAVLELTASESGIAAAILVEAGWPAEGPTEQWQDGREFSEASSSDQVTTFTSSQGAQDAAQDPNDFSNGSENFVGPAQVRRVELSGDIGDQAVIADAGSPFVVDAMDGTMRLTYGFRQTGNLLSMLKRSAALKFHLRLRELGAPLYATPIELNGLEDALRALRACANR